MGGEPSHLEVPEGFPPSGGTTNRREETTVTSLWEQVLIPARGGHEGGGPGGDGYLYLQASEYSHGTHRNLAHF